MKYKHNEKRKYPLWQRLKKTAIVNKFMKNMSRTEECSKRDY